MGDEDLCDYGNGLMFSCVSSPQEAHDIGGVHFVKKKCYEQWPLRGLWDSGLILPKLVFVSNQYKITGMTFDKHLCHVWDQDMGFTEYGKFIIQKVS